MTTANTENEDLQGLVKPKKDDGFRPQGPVHHESEPAEPVVTDPVASGPIDSSGGGGTQPDGPVHHESEPLKLHSGGTKTDGPVHHESEPAKSS